MSWSYLYRVLPGVGTGLERVLADLDKNPHHNPYADMTDLELGEAACRLAERTGDPNYLGRLTADDITKSLLREFSQVIRELSVRLQKLHWLEERKRLLGDKIPAHVQEMACAVMRGDLAAAYGLIDAMQEELGAGRMRREDLTETQDLLGELCKENLAAVARLLRRAGVGTFAQLTGKTVEDVALIRGIGLMRLGSLVKFLAERGMRLRGG